MDLPLARTVLDSSRRRRRWILLLAAVGFSGYGAYKVYHLPSVTRKRKKLAKLFRTLVSVAETISSSADTVSLVSADMNRFLRSDSDEIPTSLKQISKMARSDEFAGSLSRVSEALTVGIMRGVRSGPSWETKSGSSVLESPTSASFSDRVIDKLFSTAGSGFASVVVGSFARGLVLTFYSSNAHCSATEVDDLMAGTTTSLASDTPAVPGWVHLICSDKCRTMIGDCIQTFVSTAVAVYLDKTMDINTYDELLSGLTNPKHESKVKDVLVSVCNGAVETLVKTSHQVLTSSDSSSSMNKAVDIQQYEELPQKNVRRSSIDDEIRGNGGWVDKVSTTLAVPSNRRFVLDVTGRVTFETVRSFLDFVLWKLSNGARRGANVIRGEIVESGLEIVRYISAKSVVIITVCLALCLHVLAGTRVLLSA